jgi:dodecin
MMADHQEPTYRLSEIVGTSSESVHNAIRNGIARASETVRHLDWFEVKEVRGTIVDGNVGLFQVTMKVGFLVED